MDETWRKSKQKFPAESGSQSEATKTAQQLNSNTRTLKTANKQFEEKKKLYANILYLRRGRWTTGALHLGPVCLRGQREVHTTGEQDHQYLNLESRIQNLEQEMHHKCEGTSLRVRNINL